MKKQKTSELVETLLNAGITYEEIAVRCQVKIATVRNYKCGSQEPGKFPREKICLMVMELGA
jgi:transcriptional regulator with XRE-family HTH domain